MALFLAEATDFLLWRAEREEETMMFFGSCGVPQLMPHNVLYDTSILKPVKTGYAQRKLTDIVGKA